MKKPDNPMRVLLLLPMLFAIAAADTPWSNWGFTLNATRNEGDLIIDRVVAPGGSEFEVTHRVDLQSGDIDRINQMQGIFSQWKTIKLRGVAYMVDGVKVDASLTPDAISYSNRDLKDNLPAGIAFSYIGALAFDFRLLQSNMFVRIQGVYNGEEALLKKLYEAAANPLLYVRKNDPNYFGDRLTRIETELLDAVLEMRSNNAIAHASMAKDLETTRRGAFAYAMAASPKPVDAKLIDGVLSARKADPKAAVKAILELLKKDGVKASEKEIALVLALWFNEK
jgi:hypothetical protein